MKKVSLKSIGIIVAVWVADVITKYFAVQALSDGSNVQIISEYLQLKLVYNTGGVFGIFQGNAMVFHLMSGVAILFLLVYYLRAPYEDFLFNLSVCFVLGGALGNFTDRFFRPGVVDFIDMGFDIHRWPTYNVADAFISFGAVILLVSFYLTEKQGKKPAKK